MRADGESTHPAPAAKAKDAIHMVPSYPARLPHVRPRETSAEGH
jgi:hypothetical protein